MKDNFKIFLFMVLIIAVATGGYFWKRDDKKMQKEDVIDGGVVKDRILPGYSDNINSKDIIKFEYNGEFKVLCELMEDGLRVKASGGSSYYRDGSYFKLDYISSNNDLLNRLQDIIDTYNITKNNGYEHETSGLPAGLGDNISVLYESGEKIWKYSNQSPTISEEAVNEIYDAFKKNAQDNNLDFNSDGSNTILYDDATTEFLEGSWKGTHFGKEYRVIFKENNVKIYEDDELIDNANYIIIDGRIVPNSIRDGVNVPKDYHDYLEFNVISIMSKKNDFTLTAYFMKNSYSTCDLLKQK